MCKHGEKTDRNAEKCRECSQEDTKDYDGKERVKHNQQPLSL
nr:MAG TPA: hypothetical protein [Caudoviricetes sp.]